MESPYQLTEKFPLFAMRAIMTEPSIFIRARTILKPEYFENTPAHSCRKFIEYLHEYYNEHGVVPLLDQVNARLSAFNIQEQPITKVDGWNSVANTIPMLSEIEQYCRHRACCTAALKVYTDIEKGSTSGVVKELEKALMVSLPHSFGTPIFSSSQDIIKEFIELHSTQYELRTGWTEIDMGLAGGFGYGEINVFSAPAGMGKSVVLANLGLNYAKQGRNVLYFSLELNEGLIKKRIISMLTGFPLRTMKGAEDMVGLQYDETMEKIGRENVGDYNIIQVPNGATTADIESIVNEYETRNEKTVNIIIVDYADLMSPCEKVSRENIHLVEKFIYEELRGLAVKRTANGRKTMILTASQLGKGSLGKDMTEWDQDSLAGSVGKNFTCDNLITIYANNAMKEQGIMKLKFLKTRNSAYTKEVELSYNIDTLRVSDFDVTKSGNPELDKMIIGDLSPNNDSNKIINTIIKPVVGG